jgi:hypothetical protein
MQAIQSRARLAEPAAAAPMRRPALAISRAAAEEALRDGDGPVELTFDVVRVGGATEAMRMILERSDLERTLQSADGEELALVFDPDATIHQLWRVSACPQPQPQGSVRLLFSGITSSMYVVEDRQKGAAPPRMQTPKAAHP